MGPTASRHRPTRTALWSLDNGRAVWQGQTRSSHTKVRVPSPLLAPLRECVEQERALSSIYDVGIADPVILSAGRGFVGSLPPGVPAAPGDSRGDACGPLVRVIF